MTFRTYSHEQQVRPAPAADGGGAAGDQLGQLAAHGQELLRAGDDAIDNALSSDSQQFLLQTEQTGGE
jgi:hypothetical protein